MELPKHLVERIGKLRAVDFQTLDRKDDLGIQFGFTEISPIIKKIYEKIITISDHADEIDLPTTKVIQLGGAIDILLEIIGAIKVFDPKENPDPKNLHKAIIERAKSLEEQVYKDLEQILTAIKVNQLASFSTEAGANELIAKITEIKNSIDKDTEKIAEMNSEAKKAAQEARDLFGERGTQISRSDFEAQANCHQKLGRNWLIAFIVSLVVALCLVLGLFGPWSMVYNKPDIGTMEFIEILIFRVLILSIVFIFVQQSLKNYQVNRHLYVVNRHRQLAMTVYPYMTKASNETAEKNTIITQASKAIFEQGSSGYLEIKSEQTMPINLTEVINHLPKNLNG